MSRIYYHKLIRDKVPANIRATGSDCEIKILNRKDFEKELLDKAIEEASGLAAAKSRKELVSEVADVLEVLEAIKKLKKISAKEMKAELVANKKAKGGYKKRIFLVWSSDDSYRTNEPKGKPRRKVGSGGKKRNIRIKK